MSVQQRIRDVLAAMSQVSEAPGQSVVIFDPNTHHEASIPSGVRSSASIATLDPAAARSLYDEWADRFDQLQAADDFVLSRMVLEAETALAAYTHRHPGREVDEHGDPTKSIEAYCLSQYEGVDPEAAGVIHSASHGDTPNRNAAWIRKVRRDNDRHPETGAQKVTGEGRLRLVAELQGAGHGAPHIARELACAVSTAQKLMAQVEQQRDRAA